MSLEKHYDAAKAEAKWYEFWENNGFFVAGRDPKKPPFSMVIPPPNVTGSLHMGHALNNTIQDIIARFKRMDGYDVLWLPGTDHAGIATQNVVEKALAQEGVSRHDIGREEFVKRVWRWKEEYGNKIINQLKRLGASCDWTRQRFTMDEGLSRAVRTVFKRLYDEGLIYRSKYIINWCPRCHTALSDIEVEYEPEQSHLWYIRYPIENTDEYVVVATTRPETMLGDTAVAVNPADPRYKKYIGKFAILPIVNRRIPIIADEYVDMEFGTGALKITPAHDPNDFEIGRKYGLDTVVVMDSYGRMNENALHYAGMDRYVCRKKIVEELKEKGFLEKIEDYEHSVGHCYRCHTQIEPYISEQWFVRMKPLAEPAIAAVEKGDVSFIPDFWKNTYFSWLHNIRDWCISRQIWWGHRIPVWYCQDCGAEIVEIDEPQKCPKCGSTHLKQDEDVLDTWFSSALWPFSTLGWPEETDDLKRYYPTSVLSTGFDIIYFWVARMIMMGLHFMKKEPFRQVYIHALIRDKDGQKMSKSRGNVIDPLDMIEKYGTDALRFTLTALAAQGRDIRLDEKRFEGYRNFMNKLWNASRFIISNTQDFEKESVLSLKATNPTLLDRWILTELNRTIEKARLHFERFEFNDYAHAVYDFFWHQFCDWYIEFSKHYLYDEQGRAHRKEVQRILLYVLDKALKLLHPIIPFITEELWQNLPIIHEETSIMITRMPKVDSEFIDDRSVSIANKLKATITAIRNVRSVMNIPYTRRIRVLIKTALPEFREYEWAIKRMTLAESVELNPAATRPENSMSFLAEDIEGFVYLEGVVDIEKEKERLAKKLDKIEQQLSTVEKRLNNDQFLAKAPPSVVEREKNFREELRLQREKLIDNLKHLEG